MRYLRYALFTLLAALAAPAAAQVPGCTPGIQCVLLQTFTPQGVPIMTTATMTSSTVPLPAVGPTLGVLISNAGPAAAYVLPGPVGQVVTQYTGTYVAPGVPVWLPIGTNAVLASITTFASATLTVIVGSGAPMLIPAPIQVAPAAPLVYIAPDTATVGITSAALAVAGTYALSLRVCTLPGSSSNVWLNARGAPAIVGSGVEVAAGGAPNGCATFGPGGMPLPLTTINAITDGVAPQAVSLSGG